MMISAFSGIGYAQPMKPSSLFFCLYEAPPPAQSKKAYPTYQGLAYSSDKGVNWKTCGWLTSGSNDIDRDPLDESVYYLASEYGLMKSTNGGMAWKVVTPWNIAPVLRVKALPHLLWIGTADGSFISTDDGMNWEKKSNGLPLVNGTLINDMLLFADTMLVATDDGVYRSVDSGRVWKPYALQGNVVSQLVKAPGPSPMLAAINNGEGVWMSADGGATWDSKAQALQSLKVQTVIFHPTDPMTVFIGTQDLGIMKTADGGNSWKIMSNGLQNFNIVSLAFDRDDPLHVYAGAENGAFESKDGGRSWNHSTLKHGYVSAIRMF
jgi:photosystem II stability/assembly factor-like uncharacterized protein